MDINEYILKISGSSFLPEPMEMNREYLLTLRGAVKDIHETDNEDGTVDRTYSVKQDSVEVMTSGGLIIKTKSRSPKSKALRGAIYYYWQDHKPGETGEDYYDKVMNAIIVNLDDIIERYLV